MPDQYGRPTFGDWAGIAGTFTALGERNEARKDREETRKDREVERTRDAQRFEWSKEQQQWAGEQHANQQTLFENQQTTFGNEQEDRKRKLKIESETPIVSEALRKNPMLFQSDMTSLPQFQGFAPEAIQRGRAQALVDKANEISMSRESLLLRQAQTDIAHKEAINKFYSAGANPNALADAINAFPGFEKAYATGDGKIAVKDPYTDKESIYTPDQIRTYVAQNPGLLDGQTAFAYDVETARTVNTKNLQSALAPKVSYTLDGKPVGFEYTQVKAMGNGQYRAFKVFSDKLPIDQGGKTTTVIDPETGTVSWDQLKEIKEVEGKVLDIQAKKKNLKADPSKVHTINKSFWGDQDKALEPIGKGDQGSRRNLLLADEFAGKLIDAGSPYNEAVLSASACRTVENAEILAKAELADYEIGKLTKEKFKAMGVSSADEFLTKRKEEILGEELEKAKASFREKPQIGGQAGGPQKPAASGTNILTPEQQAALRAKVPAGQPAPAPGAPAGQPAPVYDPMGAMGGFKPGVDTQGFIDAGKDIGKALIWSPYRDLVPKAWNKAREHQDATRRKMGVNL